MNLSLCSRAVVGIWVLAGVVAGASCSSDSANEPAVDACGLLKVVDVDLDLSEFYAFADRSDLLGCRAFDKGSADGARLLIHRRVSAADAQQFMESYLSDPPSDDVQLSSGFAKIASGNLVLVLETNSGDQLDQYVVELANAAVNQPLAFGSEAEASPATATTQPATRVESPLSLVVETQTVDEVCYRVESGGEVAVESSCVTGQILRDGDPPAETMFKLSIDGRDVILYAIGAGFEVADVRAEPQDVHWGTAPPGWLLITIAPEVGRVDLVLTSSDGTIVCNPKPIRPTCEAAS